MPSRTWTDEGALAVPSAGGAPWCFFPCEKGRNFGEFCQQFSGDGDLSIKNGEIMVIYPIKMTIFHVVNGKNNNHGAIMDNDDSPYGNGDSTR